MKKIITFFNIKSTDKNSIFNKLFADFQTIKTSVNKLKPNDSNDIFKKTDCYDIHNNGPNLYNNFKIENPELIMVVIAPDKKEVLENYIIDSLNELHLGNIYLSDQTLKCYQDVQVAMKKNIKIEKSVLEFVLYDMDKSYINNNNKVNKK